MYSSCLGRELEVIGLGQGRCSSLWEWMPSFKAACCYRPSTVPRKVSNLDFFLFVLQCLILKQLYLNIHTHGLWWLTAIIPVLGWVEGVGSGQCEPDACLDYIACCWPARTRDSPYTSIRWTTTSLFMLTGFCLQVLAHNIGDSGQGQWSWYQVWDHQQSCRMWDSWGDERDPEAEESGIISQSLVKHPPQNKDTGETCGRRHASYIAQGSKGLFWTCWTGNV